MSNATTSYRLDRNSGGEKQGRTKGIFSKSTQREKRNFLASPLILYHFSQVISFTLLLLSHHVQVLKDCSDKYQSSPQEQESYVRRWLEERITFTSAFIIRFYPGKFAVDKRSILAVGDISEIISDQEADIAVLEEPEHLTWFHHGKRWKTKFRLVIGIVHTNYLEYVKREKNGRPRAFFLKHVNTWVVGIYCHKCREQVGLPNDLGTSYLLPHRIILIPSSVMFMELNPKFLEIGKRKIEQQQSGNQAFTKGAYYIGKMVWSKGYKELLELLHDHQTELAGLQVDLYGTGEDSNEVQEAANKLKLVVRVYAGRDHADPVFHE
ncbi:hypothetical protein Patl1_00390 [Pistacia atlantica]|uniref:Uncharacterized protein n=1 Tax=Pistacia atlantica TaxID=434234 RepID=A0ACC1C9Y8_9ROSI|nr:hypothetical protein Patl1_00390 [Pistacia atlantica]